MDLERTDVYVPRPADASRGEGEEAPWPRPVYRPQGGGEDRALARRVEEALGWGSGARGPESDPRDVTSALRDPDLLRRVADRLAREAHRRGCSVVAAVEPRGSLLGAPLALRADLPLVVIGRGEEGPDDGESVAYEDDGEAAVLGLRKGSLEAEDRVMVVDDVLLTGATLAAACELVERAGARVEAVAVLVEFAERVGRHRLSDHKLMSILTL